MKGRLEFETIPMKFPDKDGLKQEATKLKAANFKYGASVKQIAKGLAKVKPLLTPTQWSDWLRLEFGWTEELAEFLMKEAATSRLRD